MSIKIFMSFVAGVLLIHQGASAPLPLTPPNPREYGGSPLPDGGAGEERGAYFTALQTFSITGLGIEGDLDTPSLTLMANIYAATGSVRGPLLASQSLVVNDLGARFYDVPINFTFTNGAQYDVAIDFQPHSDLRIRFFEYDPLQFTDPPYEVGGLVRVFDGEASGSADNYVLPHLQLLLVASTNSPCAPAAVYQASTIFSDGLGSITMTMAFDGTNYWSVSGGGANGTRLARYDASGTVLGTFSPGLDFRSIFADQAGTVFARAYNSRIIRRQTSPGVFVPAVTLTNGTLDSQAAVVLNGAGTEFIALSAGAVSRWDLAGNHLGAVTLNGFGGSELALPQGRGIAAFRDFWLTYNKNGILSFWDAAGTRMAQATLLSAGVTDSSAFSFSTCNGRVFIVDNPAGLWRGYDLCNAGAPPEIITQPESQTVTVGTPVTFSVIATSPFSLSYQWRKNGADIVGAINSTHVFNLTQPGDAGEYTVRVSNAYGSVLSSNATLTVISGGLVLTASDGGWYDASGFHDGGNLNYYAGDGPNNAPLRNWFVFNIPALPGAIRSAALRINTYSIMTSDNAETYQLRHVHTPAAELAAGGSGQTLIYADLADGTIYGTRTFNASEANQIISMPLNAALIADLTAAAGGSFALGGEIISLDGIPNEEAIFYGSDRANVVELVLDVAPAETIISTTNSWNGTEAIFAFGEPDTSTYGQTFVAPPEAVLTRFIFYVKPENNPGPIDFKFYVMAWDGSKATGPILFQSPSVSTFNRPEMQPYEFDTGSLALTPGGEYVAFVSASTLFDGIIGTGSMGGLTPGSYNDGHFVYLNHANDFGALTTRVWEAYPDWDLAFVAVFGFQPGESRIVRVQPTTPACGGELTVPVTLNATGSEHALGFSLSYDASLLSNPQVHLEDYAGRGTVLVNDSQPGQLGIALALFNDGTFIPGSNELLRVTFAVASVASNLVTEITLGDEPVFREISDVSAQTLSGSYQPGAISILAGYEGDVAPRPDGHSTGSVTITDWVQVGRFAMGLDQAAFGSEFQRADCAPLADCGEGVITVADWVQAGRFAAGLDPVKRIAGPTATVFTPVNAAPAPEATTRSMRIADRTMRPNSIDSVDVELTSEGDENAVGFSMAFDAIRLRFLDASLGASANGASLLMNTNESSGGRVALALALPAGRTFTAGARQILSARFAVSPSAPLGQTAVTFGHQPVTREISDALAQPVNANYVGGIITIAPGNVPLRLLPPQRLPGGAFRLWVSTEDGSPVDPARIPKIQLRATASLATPVPSWSRVTSAPTLVNGVVRIDDPQAATQSQRFYTVVEAP